jgi:hypothetical protein
MNESGSRLFYIVIVLVVVLVVVGVGGKFLIDKIADRVIQKLQKEYSPSPYGPGLDPDKVDAESIRRKTK